MFRNLRERIRILSLIEWIIFAMICGILLTISINVLEYKSVRVDQPANFVIPVYEIEYNGKTIPCATKSGGIDCAWELLNEK